MAMDEPIQRLPSREEWLDTPVEPKDWPGKQSPPNKREFFEWLEAEVGIIDFNTKYGMWQNIVFSASWLARDERTRPSNKELSAKLEMIEKRIDEIRTVVSTSEKQADLDGWTKYYLRSAEIQMQAHGAIDSITRNLDILRILTEDAASLVKKTKPGRRKDHTLWDWVAALSAYIDVFTDIKIKVDFENGEPITPYSRLVCKAVEMLDSERLPRVESILKQYRTAHNKAKNSTN